MGGLTLGADPIAYAIAYASAATDAPVRAFTVRKEPKTHGTGRLIEGPFKAGDSVVVIEDTITTGSSALRAIDAVRESGGSVAGVLALVDREEGGREALEAKGHRVISLARASEITTTNAGSGTGNGRRLVDHVSREGRPPRRSERAKPAKRVEVRYYERGPEELEHSATVVGIAHLQCGHVEHHSNVPAEALWRGVVHVVRDVRD